MRPLALDFAQVVIVVACLTLVVPAALSADLAPSAHSWIVAFPSAAEDALRGAGVEIWTRSGDAIVGGAGDEALAKLDAAGLRPLARVVETGQSIFLLHHDDGMIAPPSTGATIFALSPATDLYVYSSGIPVTHPFVKPNGAFMGIPRIPLAPARLHDADVAAAMAVRTPTTVNPLVTQIVNATSQANWFQDVKDLSGENSVLVSGVMRTISTRFSGSMFPTPASNAYASEYLLEKGAGWGYTGVRESYTRTNSGCGTAQTGTWQNLIFTLPGQIDFGQHQQVIFVTHYDSLSFSTVESQSYAPGADDAISGGSALIEALRLFKDYGFANTVKIIFFSGEEQGLCGSEAYAHMHPTADMWRVVNMDQTAYDGNLNSLMDCYNWSLASSPNSVALGDAFVQANLDYGSIINPANIVRDTTHMCQTDHCPFWDVGVAAIALCEDLHNGDICPCFDTTQSASCHDTITQVDPSHSPRLMFNPDFSWPTEKAAIALVASLAGPLYACPTSAPTLGVSPLNQGAHLTWPATGTVTNYVVERSTDCAGTFTPLSSVTTTSFDDSGLTNGTTYAYRLRTCPNQVSACQTVVPVGASVGYQTGSATVTSDTGDHDNVPDNCELVGVGTNVVNDGSFDLTNVKVTAIGSSDAAVQIVTAMPIAVGPLSIGQSVPVNFSFKLGENGTSAACNETLPFAVTVVSDQTPATPRSFSLQAEKDTQSGTLTYGFETDFSGWTTTAGVWTLAAGGAPGSTTASLHSRSQNNDCDAIASPTFTPQATSTMTMWVNFSIEGNNGGPSRSDRAVVRVINTTNGTKTLIAPSAVLYNSTGVDPSLCDGIGNLQGWTGDHLGWSQASFNLASFAGIPIQTEVRFSTDSSTLGTQGTAQGFWFDQVAITNAIGNGCDSQSNVCQTAPAEVSPSGAPVPLTISKGNPSEVVSFSESATATAYHIYAGTLAALQAGTYDHAVVAGLCGFTDASPGDGSVTVTAALPENDYFLAVAANAQGESSYGSSTAGPIPSASPICP